jgi:kynurenine formamidase
VRSLSNWGRFGPDDEHGTLNLIDGAARRSAAHAVLVGEQVLLARPLGTRAAPDNPRPMLHHMLRSGESARPGFHTASDWIGLGFHGFGTTHVDALSHVMWDGLLYNGRRAEVVTTAVGATQLSVLALAGRLGGRGVLLDLPRALGIPFLERGSAATPDDLDRCLTAQRVEVRSGDIVLVRTGRDVARAEEGARDPLADGLAGLLPACCEWLRRRDVAVLGSDGVSDVLVPSGAPHLMPIHVIALVALGMPLIDNMLLEDLARACAARDRWDFLFLGEPLPIRNATGSPIAPVAVL